MVEATIKYPAGHSYTFEYEAVEEMYCPDCGLLGHIWCETREGDYYCGPSYYCASCATQFTIQEGGRIKEDHHYFAVIKAIRST